MYVLNTEKGIWYSSRIWYV